jgi:DNA processing protein
MALGCRNISVMPRPASPAPGPDQTGPFTPEQLLGPLNPQEQRFAPKALFAAGHLDWLRRSRRVAIVGARRSGESGLRRARKLTRILVEQDVTIVSGLAAGIDAAAHTTAIEAGGRTVAVIGTPLSKAYPQAHRALQQQLMREHLVISQFPEGATTSRRSFPLRNRTMALISEASVIVEAGDGSGSLSQGWEALRLGRPLFLMASLLDRSDLSWPRTMIEYGAMVLRTPEDLLEQLPDAVDDPLAAIA